MLKKSLAVLALTALLATTAQAQTKVHRNYVGGNLAFMNYSKDGVSDDASLNVLVGRLGAFINRNIAAEMRFGVGLGHDTVTTIDGYNAKVELNYMVGGYVRGIIPITRSISPYVIGGVTHGDLTASVSSNGYSFSNTDSGTDLSLGLGVDIAMLQGFGLNFEYMHYLNKNDVKVEALTFGVTKRF